MAETEGGAETPRLSFDTIRSEVAAKDKGVILNDFFSHAISSRRLLNFLDDYINANGYAPPSLEGKVDDEESAKGWASETNKASLEILAALYEKDMTPEKGTDEERTFAKKFLDSIRDNVNPAELDERGAAYFYSLIQKSLNGKITDAQSLVTEFRQIGSFKKGSPTLFRQIQEAAATSIIGEEYKGKPIDEEMARKSLEVRDKEEKKEAEKRRERVTEEELQKFQELWGKMRDALKDLNEKEMIAFKTYLTLGGDFETVRPVADKIGWSEDDIIEYLELERKSRSTMHGRGDAYLEKNLHDAQTEFSSVNIIKDLLSENDDGTYQMHSDPKMRRRFKRRIKFYLDVLFQTIDANPSQNFDKVYNVFQQGFYLHGIQAQLKEMINDKNITTLLGGERSEEYLEYKGYVENVLNYTFHVINYREMYHDTMIHIRDAEVFPKLKGFFSRLFASEMTIFLEDPITRIAVNEMERYVRSEIALNKNQLRSDMFSGKNVRDKAMYLIEDDDRLKARLKKIIKRITTDPEFAGKYADRFGLDVSDLKDIQDWEISGAIPYAKGIGFNTLRLPEIASTATPPEAFVGGIWHDILGFMKDEWNWRRGRGGPGILQIPELFSMEAVYNAPNRGIVNKIFSRRKWSPKEVAAAGKKKISSMRQELGEKIDFALLDRSGTYRELMNHFNMGSVPTRAGWRFDYLVEQIKKTPIGKTIDDSWKDWGRAEWGEVFKWITEEKGVGMQWALTPKRLENEMKRYFVETMGLGGKLKGEINEAVDEYSKGKKSNQPIFTASVLEGDKRVVKKVHYNEYMQWREWELRGEYFYNLFKRAPSEFITNLSQLAPEVHDTAFWETLPAGASSDEKFNRELEKKRFLKKWGPTNIKHFERIANFFKDLKSNPALKEKVKTELKLDSIDDVKDIDVMRYYTEEMEIALEKVRIDKRTEMIKTDIDDEEIRKIIFGEGEAIGGLVGYFELPENKEDFGDYNKLGDQGFFYRTAREWMRRHGDFNPNTSDVDYYELYEEIAKVGENTFKRALSDPAGESVMEVRQTLANLDQLLLSVGSHGDEGMKGIYELQQKIHGLKAIYGEPWAHKANFLLTSLVASYFWEDSITRDVTLGQFPILNTPLRMFLGRNLSLSKIHGDRFAHSLDSNGLRQYFRKLHTELEVLPENGPYSYKQLMENFDASNASFAFEAGVPIAFVIITYLLFKYIEQSFKEEVDEGKKR